MDNSAIIFLKEQKAIKYDGKSLSSADISESKKYPTGITIPLKYLKQLSFNLPNSTKDEEVTIQAEIKMFKEGGLDSEKDYAIDFLKFDLGDSYLVEVYALAYEDFNEIVKSYPKIPDAIDFSIVRFLIYQSLYEDRLDKNSNDLFIYIGDDEAIGAIYKDGRYIGHRNLNSLSSISKRVGIEKIKVKELLRSKGLIKDNYDIDQKHIVDLIEEIMLKDIEKIVYSINHKRSTFGLSTIDNIYMDFFGDTIDGLREYFVSYGHDSVKVNVLPTISEDDTKDAHTLLEAKYLFDLANQKDELQQLNLSILERKKPLKEYLSVKFAFLIGLCLIVVFGIFGYFFYEENMLDRQIVERNTKLSVFKKRATKYKKNILKLKEQNKKLLKLIKTQEDQNRVYELTLKTIPLIRENISKRERFMNEVILALAKYHLNTKYIKQTNLKHITVLIVSKPNKRDNIGKFINELTKKKNYSVLTKEIKMIDDLYVSKVDILR